MEKNKELVINMNKSGKDSEPVRLDTLPEVQEEMISVREIQAQLNLLLARKSAISKKIVELEAEIEKLRRVAESVELAVIVVKAIVSK